MCVRHGPREFLGGEGGITRKRSWLGSFALCAAHSGFAALMFKAMEISGHTALCRRLADIC